MVEFGKKIYPKKRTTVIEDTRVTGPTWSIERQGDRYVFEYLSGDHSGQVKRAEVTVADFQAVHDGKMTDYDLLLKYGLS